MYFDKEKIRKTWLITTMIQGLFSFASSLHLSLNTSSMESLGKSLSHLFLGCLLYTFLSTPAYKKYGTAYLTFGLIFGPPATLFSFIYEWKYVSSLIANQSPPSLIFLTLLTFLLETSIFLTWYFWSLKLRKVNQGVKKELIHASESFQKAKKTLDDSTELDDLDSKFSKIAEILEANLSLRLATDI